MHARLLLVLALLGSPAFAHLPCYKLVKAAGAIAQRQAAQPAVAEAFGRAVFRATQEVARKIDQPTRVEPFEPFPSAQKVDYVDLGTIVTDPIETRSTILGALSLVGKAAPAMPLVATVAPRGLFSRLLNRTTAPQAIAAIPVVEPILPTGYRAFPILVQGRESILRALDELDVALELTSAQTANWWTTTTLGSVVVWPFGLWRAGEVLFDKWAYEQINFSGFATSVRDAIAIATPPTRTPLNFLVSVRNPAVSYQLVFHWSESAEPMLLGSYSEVPPPAEALHADASP